MIVEILKINDTISQMIAKNKSKYEISSVAKEKGLFTPMSSDGVSKALRGVIPLEEVTRVSRGEH